MPDAVDRMRSRMHASIAADALAPLVRRPRFRARHAAFAFSGAAVIALAVALSPLGRDSSTSNTVLAPTSAEAALEQAADAAGAVEWAPLGDNEYHHTMATTFTPKIPPRKNDPQKKIDQMFSMNGPMSSEAWLDRDGLGFLLDATGGNGDPNLYPSVQKDGYGWGPTFGRKYPEPETVSVTDSLRLADNVRVTRSLPRNRAEDGLWYRTPRGFERKAHMTQDARYVSGGSFPRYMQQRVWAATMQQIDAVNNASDEQRPAAIARLLDQEAKEFGNAGSFGRPGQYGVTKRTQKEDSRIVRAIELLGSAPLSPAVRQDLFTWLSNRPIAKLDGTNTDVSGRTGTRVTFERIYDEVVPAHTVTVDDLRDQVEQATGTRPTESVRGPQSIRIKRDHQYRRFYVSIVFDTRTGELLEYVLYGRVETTAQKPRLERNTIGRPGTRRPAWRVAMGVDRQGMSDAQLYGIRERTTEFSNVQTAACEMTPRMCR